MLSSKSDIKFIVTRTPVRVSFVGGGSDLPSFYTQGGGEVISTAINKWIDVALRIPPSSLFRQYKISCPNTHQKVDSINQIKNAYIRETLRLLDIAPPIEIKSFSDVPPGTGLGSSSSFLVGLLHALYTLLGTDTSPNRLLEAAFHLEATTLKNEIGKQDHAIASFGGLSHFFFQPNHTVNVESVQCLKGTIEALNKNLMLFYTGRQRRADSILSRVNHMMHEKSPLINHLKSFCKDLRTILENEFSFCSRR